MFLKHSFILNVLFVTTWQSFWKVYCCKTLSLVIPEFLFIASVLKSFMKILLANLIVCNDWVFRIFGNMKAENRRNHFLESRSFLVQHKGTFRRRLPPLMLPPLQATWFLISRSLGHWWIQIQWIAWIQIRATWITSTQTRRQLKFLLLHPIQILRSLLLIPLTHILTKPWRGI